MGKKKSRAAGINKKDLTERLAYRAGIPKVRAAEYINTLTHIISDALLSGKKVTISDFGTFTLSTRSAFKGYDPSNNKTIQVPRRIIPVFRAGKMLKNALNLPMLRNISLTQPQQIRAEFTRLVDPSDENLLVAQNYLIQLDDAKPITATNVEIEHQEEYSDSNSKELKKGVRSIRINFPEHLLEKKSKLQIQNPPQDLSGNRSETPIFWPRK
ncbi:MAG: hypothetical protein CMK59_13155 [Proteobacteria bacterium]|nr:hypothetical protein [Pseudomonadota bacterium]